MIEETYLKQITDCAAIVSFQGDLDGINRIREYAKHMYDAPTICCDEYEEDEQEYDAVNHPSHYTSSGMECIDEMVLLYGEEETMSFCKLNAHKYRKRALNKGGKEDMEKSDWYLAKYRELKNFVEQQKQSDHNAFITDISQLLHNGGYLNIGESGFSNMYEKFIP
jgi:hypothetical protein